MNGLMGGLLFVGCLGPVSPCPLKPGPVKNIERYERNIFMHIGYCTHRDNA